MNTLWVALRGRCSVDIPRSRDGLSVRMLMRLQRKSRAGARQAPAVEREMENGRIDRLKQMETAIKFICPSPRLVAATVAVTTSELTRRLQIPLNVMTDRRTNGWMDGWTDGRADGQAEDR